MSLGGVAVVETATGYSALAGGIIFNHCRYISHPFYTFTSVFGVLLCSGLHRIRFQGEPLSLYKNTSPNVVVQMDSTHPLAITHEDLLPWPNMGSHDVCWLLQARGPRS